MKLILNVISLILLMQVAQYTHAGKLRLRKGIAITSISYNKTEYNTSSSSHCLMKCPEDNCMGVTWIARDKLCNTFHSTRTPTCEGMSFSRNAAAVSFYRVESYTARKMVASLTNCPNDVNSGSWYYSSAQGSCYYHTSQRDISGTHQDMTHLCSVLLPGYSRLVYIDDQEEADYIQNLTITNNLGWKKYWIGLHRSLDKTWFSNPSNNDWPMIYQNWDQSEPNRIHEECVVINLQANSGLWADSSCGGTAYAICEIDVEGIDKLYHY